MTDFTYKTNEDAFFDAIAKTFDKDNVDIIESRSYEYFKTTLNERLEAHMKKDIESM